MSKATIITRASLVLGALSVLVGGVTYAAVTSSATLTGNTLASVTAGLKVDGPDANTDFTESEPGLVFDNIVPGAADYGTAKQFSLKNEGTGNLKVAITAAGGTPSGTFDASKVWVKVTNTALPGSPVAVSLDNFSTLFNNLPGVSGAGSLAAGDTATFNVQVWAAADAVSGAGAKFENFDLTFTGTAVE